MKQPPIDVINKISHLLTQEENQGIARLLGNRCQGVDSQSISTCVAQLFVTEPPGHGNWLKKDVGVLCFVKDNIKKSYFFRLFCIKRNCLLWEHEMYNNLDYLESTVFFHIFEGEEGMVAFNFASEDEARDLKRVVEDKINARKRRDEKRSRQQREAQTHMNKSHTLNPETLNFKKTTDPAIKQAKRRRNITKADIGSPSDFKHISHVGWNPDSGFDIDIEDPQLKSFFEKAGVSEKQLQDRDTKEFIYDFINKHGGREAVEQSANRNRRAPAVPHQAAAPPVPPVPPRGNMKQHVRTAPPPPPPPSMALKNSYSESYNDVKAPPPPPPPVGGFDAAPPPPPPMGDLNNAPPAPGLNSALLDSIRSGTTLKSVEERKVVPVVEDSRNQLLQQIREGTKLKPVCERDVKPLNNVGEPRTGDLAEALARALHERSRAIHYSEDDDDDDDDSNDDEWED